MRKLALALLYVFAISGTVLAGTITPDLAAKLHSSPAEELIPVMLMMSQQSDKDVLQDLTAGMDKQDARVTVTGYLKDMAASTQRDIRAYLESAQNSGKVSHVYPVYIVNMMYTG